MKLSIILLIIVISFIGNVYSQGLIATRKNFKNSDIDVFYGDFQNSGPLFNHSITLPYNLQVQGISNINYTTNVVTLFCTRQANGEDYSSLVWIDVKSGEINEVSNFIAKPIDQVLNNGITIQNYLFGHYEHHKNQVYLASTISNLVGLNIVHWNFQSTNQLVNIYPVLDTSDIDTTIQPLSELEVNGNLIVAYHSKNNPSNIVTIVKIDFNGTTDSIGGSESNELIPFESYEIDLGYKGSVQIMYYIYTDFIGSVYIAMDNVELCKVDFIEKTCNTTYQNNIESLYYPTIFQPQDRNGIVTISSPPNPQLSQPLTLGIWQLDFSGGISYNIPNFYTIPNTYTFLSY